MVHAEGLSDKTVEGILVNYHPPNHYKLHREQRSDRNPNWIPTIVNDQVKQTKKDTDSGSTTKKSDYIRNLLNDFTTKLHNIRANYSECCKHKVLLIEGMCSQNDSFAG